MPVSPPTRAELAAALAGRVLHDIAGQASGLLAAFDLLADPGAAAMRDDALALAEQSARRLARRLALQRAVLSGGEPLSARQVEAAANDLFAESRARLDLSMPDLPAPLASRLLLGLLQIVNGVATTGTVSAAMTSEEGSSRISVEISGARARLREEELLGLSGSALTEGQAHRWALAYWLWSMCGEAGGTIKIEGGEGRVSITVQLGKGAGG